MAISDGFYIDVERIHIAHEYVLDGAHKCEYPRGRGSFGLILALQGKAEYRFASGDRVTVSRGDLLFVFPHTAYSIVTEKEFRHYTVNFDVHGDTSNPEVLGSPYCLLQDKGVEQPERSFRRLVGLWRDKSTGYEMQAVGCLYELLSLFHLEYLRERRERTYPGLLLARETVEQRFAEPLTLEQLAFLSNMSVTNFRREWKKQYGDTPMQYRDAVRLYYAKEHLHSGYYTVSEVAKKCGFDDVSYFVRFFRKKTGIPPGKYQRQ